MTFSHHQERYDSKIMVCEDEGSQTSKKSSSHKMMDLLAPTLHADATLISNIKRRLATPGCPALLADMATVA
jgi:hypothetical protein